MSECINCLDNCNPRLTDRCTEYTGPDIPLLDIETGDTLYQWEAAVVESLTSIVDGSGITLSELTIDCNFLSDLLGTQDKTVANLIQVLYDADCTLKTQLDALSAIVNETFSFNTSCLTGDVSTRDEILQAVILKTCDNASRITIIENDYVKASELCEQVAACVASTTTQYNTRMVPGVVYPYRGSLSNFDNTGKGLESAGFDKIYLMNGLNTTQDWRGRSPIGAVLNVPGGTLDSAVDPSLPANPNTNYAVNARVGSSYVSLTSAQNGPHTHSLDEPSHRHSFALNQDVQGNPTNGGGAVAAANPQNGPHNQYTDSTTIGITIGASGSGLPHDNRQPSIACYYICYIP